MAAVGAVTYFLTLHHGGIAIAILSALGIAIGVLGVLVLALDWSIATILFGLGLFIYGFYPGRNDYLNDLGMVVTLFGIVLLLCGWNVMKIAWFPIAFLVVALPWPGLVYSWVAEPLSQLAAKVAVHSLNITGVDSVCSGTKIIILNSDPSLPPRILNVAEACAGMRSLMTFIAVGGAVAFLSARPLWQKLIIVASSIPIAISCNVMRISGQGLLDHYVSPQWSESFAHQFVGMMMLLPAFFLILLVAWMLDKIFIEEAEDTATARRAAPSRPMAAIQPRQEKVPVAAPRPIVAAAGTRPAAAPLISRPAPVVTKPGPAAAPVKPSPPLAAIKPGPAPRPAPAGPPAQPRMVTPPRPVTAASMRAQAAPATRVPAAPVRSQPAPARPVAAPQNPVKPVTPQKPGPVTRPNATAPAAKPATAKPKEAM